MRTLTTLLIASASMASLSLPAMDASACDYSLGPTLPTAYPENSNAGRGIHEDFPANGILLGASEEELIESDWISDEGEVLELARAAGYVGELGFYQPTAPLVEGTRYTSEGCSTASTPCGFIVGAPDQTAPDTPIISDYKVNIHERPRTGGLGGCPDLDYLALTLEISDDRAAPDHLIGLAYIADDASGVRALTAPSLKFRPHESWRAASDGDPDTIVITLGESLQRNRDGVGFRREGPFCFALTMMDRAGNESPRSEPICLSTVDEDAPYVDMVPGRLACSAAPTQPPTRLPLGLALVSFGAFIMFTKRRERDDA